MAGLLSADAFEAEQDHIREEIHKTASDLAGRQTRWTVTTIVSLILTIGLFGTGMAFIAMGALPEAISVEPLESAQSLSVNLPETVDGPTSGRSAVMAEDPFSEIFQTLTEGPLSVLTKLMGGLMLVMGLISGIARQSIMSFVTGMGGGIFMFQMPHVVQAIVGSTATQVAKVAEPEWAKPLKRAVSEKNWPLVGSLLELNNVPDGVVSTAVLERLIALKAVNDAIESGDFQAAINASDSAHLQGLDGLTMLQAKMLFLDGQHEKAAKLVRAHKLFAAEPGDAWFIEDSASQARMSDESTAYHQEQMALTSKGHKSLMGSGVMLLLTIIAGLIMADLSRNLRKIDDWLKKEATTTGAKSLENTEDRDINGTQTMHEALAEPEHKGGVS